MYCPFIKLVNDNLTPVVKRLKEAEGISGQESKAQLADRQNHELLMALQEE